MKRIFFPKTADEFWNLSSNPHTTRQEISLMQMRESIMPYGAKVQPRTKDALKKLVNDLEVFLGDIDTSYITDMSELFKDSNRKNFAGINSWNTSNVTDMSYMFANAAFFNELLLFDTSNVVNMEGMFKKAVSFNKPVVFNTDKVKNMSFMFADAKSFNEYIDIDTNALEDASYMFASAISFNQPNAYLVKLSRQYGTIENRVIPQSFFAYPNVSTEFVKFPDLCEDGIDNLYIPELDCMICVRPSRKKIIKLNFRYTMEEYKANKMIASKPNRANPRRPKYIHNSLGLGTLFFPKIGKRNYNPTATTPSRIILFHQ